MQKLLFSLLALLLGISVSYAQGSAAKYYPPTAYPPDEYQAGWGTTYIVSLESGQSIDAGESKFLLSPNIKYVMQMTPDGFLEIRSTFEEGDKLKWKSSTRADKLRLNGGELQLITDWGEERVEWSSKTSSDSPCKLVLNDDGGLLIINANNDIIWPVPTKSGSAFSIANTNSNFENMLRIGYSETYTMGDLQITASTSSSESRYGTIFKTPYGKEGAIQSINVKIIRHGSEPNGGNLYVDLYKVETRDQEGGDDPLTDQDYLTYVASSNIVNDPHGFVTAKFSNNTVLDGGAEYAFLIRTEGIENFGIGACKEAEGSHEGRLFGTYRLVTPPNDVGFIKSVGLVIELYFQVNMIAK